MESTCRYRQIYSITWQSLALFAAMHVCACRTKKPAGLEGKNWRDLRKKQRLGHNQWQPVKRLTHDQMEHLRNLRAMKPEEWTHKKLADVFGVSVPSVTRILKSKFEAPPEVRARQDAKARQQRDERREKFYDELTNKSQRDKSDTNKSERDKPNSLVNSS